MSKSLKILWIKSGPLYPLDTGGKIRTHSMLTEINKTHQVTYLAFKEQQKPLHKDEEKAPYATQKKWIPWHQARTGSLQFFFQLFTNFFFSTQPFALAKYQSTSMREALLQEDASGEFDLIICDFLSSAPNFRSIHQQLKTPTLLFQHNVESQIWKRLAASKSNFIAQFYFILQYRRMCRWERKLSHLFNGIIAVSPNDVEFFLEYYHLKNILGAVPTGVDVDFFRPIQPSLPKKGTTARQAASSNPDLTSQPENLQPTASPRIAFLGSMDWMPNIECVQYFITRVLPLIHQILPDTRFIVIGRDPAPSIQSLVKKHPLVELTGTVDDIRPHVQACDHMVVPLHAGGGTRIKIFEAMAMGVPVISTTIGAEGLPVTHGHDILIANRAQSLADASIKLIQNPDFAQKLSTNARLKVERDHSWQAVSEQFIELCQTLIK